MCFKLFMFIVAISCARSQLIRSLNAVLDYGILNKIQDMNFLIGVAIAEGQLSVTMQDAINTEQSAVLQTLQQKCSTILKSAVFSYEPLALALSPRLWRLSSPLRGLSTTPTPMPPSLAESATLSRPLSDSCLRSLLSDCSRPQPCVSAELDEQAAGYSLTHQLLYWTVFSQICNKNIVNDTIVQAVIERKCARVLGQHQHILSLGLPSALQDLYLEQVVVCGLHSFLPFLSSHNHNLLLSLQTPQGCFTTERGARLTKCDLHLSGVSTAALSLFVKLQLSQADN